ncbi:Disks Large 5 [Manis pentadactyla]|nr:Disks Large 5 [Manis pentadactyla]
MEAEQRNSSLTAPALSGRAQPSPAQVAPSSEASLSSFFSLTRGASVFGQVEVRGTFCPPVQTQVHQCMNSSSCPVDLASLSPSGYTSEHLGLEKLPITLVIPRSAPCSWQRPTHTC